MSRKVEGIKITRKSEIKQLEEWLDEQYKVYKKQVKSYRHEPNIMKIANGRAIMIKDTLKKIKEITGNI